MKALLQTLAFLVLGGLLVAEQPPPVASSQYFGLAAGTTSGVGLAWRNWPGDWGFQLTGLPVFQNTTGFVSVGFNALRRFHDTKWTRFFGYAGASSDFISGNTLTNFSAAGLGYGLEFIAFDHIAVDIQVGLGASFDLIARNFNYAGPTVEVGLYYRL